VLKNIASYVTTLLLTASLLWGGCLSCSQYFMFPVSGARHCCMPSSGCKDNKDSNNKPKKSPSSQPQDCTLQQIVIAKQVTAVDRIPNVVFLPLTPLLETSNALSLPPQAIRILSDPGSPPDLHLLHSVFRI
jgi:hypothetical protein